METLKNKSRIRDAERTIAVLKEATIELLVTKGMARLSIQPIVKAAGVSQGALFHHFPSKEHLVAAAFADLLSEFSRKLHAIGSDLKSGKIDLKEFVDQTAGTMASDMFIGSMEIALAIKSDPVLLELVAEPISEWRQSLFDFWNHTFELPGFSEEEIITHWAMASNSLRGYAFTSTFGGGEDAKERLRQGFSNLFLEKARVRYGAES